MLVNFVNNFYLTGNLVSCASNQLNEFFHDKKGNKERLEKIHSKGSVQPRLVIEGLEDKSSERFRIAMQTTKFSKERPRLNFFERRKCAPFQIANTKGELVWGVLNLNSFKKRFCVTSDEVRNTLIETGGDISPLLSKYISDQLKIKVERFCLEKPNLYNSYHEVLKLLKIAPQEKKDETIEWYYAEACKGKPRAKKVLEEIAKAKYPEAMYLLSKFYRDRVEADPTYEKLSRELLSGAARLGSISSMIELGCLIERDDPKEAVVLFQRAADQGNAFALCKLGDACLKSDMPVREEFQAALQYWHMAAERGQSEAMVYISRCYLMGWGVDQDSAKAEEWLLKAGDYPLARLSLGYLYWHGTDSVTQNKAKAKMLFKEGAKRAEPNDFLYIAKDFRDGTIIGESSEKRANYWEQKFLKSVIET